MLLIYDLTCIRNKCVTQINKYVGVLTKKFDEFFIKTDLV